MRLILLLLSLLAMPAIVVARQEPASRALTPAEFNAIVSLFLLLVLLLIDLSKALTTGIVVDCPYNVYWHFLTSFTNFQMYM